MKHNIKETFCEQAGIFYYDYLQDANLYSTEPEIFHHIEKCPFCQGEIERLKVILAEPADKTVAEKTNQKNAQVTAILASHFNLMDEKITCEIAKRFLPALADLSFDIKITTPITAHIENCCKCKCDLEAIRKLKLMNGQPAIHGKKQETTGRADFTHRADHHSHIKQLIKPLAAIAAVIFVAVWFFVGTFAKAIEFNDIYNAIGKVRNICLIRGTSGVDGAVQKVWISKDLNIKLFSSAGRWVLWDVQNKVKKSWSNESAYLKTNKLDDAELANVEQTMDIPLILLSFQNNYSLPDGYDWKLVSAKEVTGQFSDSNTQAYDLSWSNKTANGSLVYYRWRAYIDINTLLPERIENWQRYSSTEKYELKDWMDITYPQTYEIKKLIRDTGPVPG